ncbi:MAG: ClpXP protease specificity-enhancing factor SspB [Hyphomicrobiaceae bacterium]
MTGDPNTIDYEALAQDAMRGVVRTILTRVAKTGLPGDHHFYISFDTLAPGSSLSKRLKEKYPEEMTIVLQHRFWDLIVTEDRFEVKLTFDGIPERLVVPFGAIKVFFDPSVRYGLQFESPDFGPDAIAHPHTGQDDEAPGHVGRNAPTPIRPTTTRSVSERKPRTPRKPRSDKNTDDGTPETTKPPLPQRRLVEHKPAEPAPAAKAETKPAPAPAPAGGNVPAAAPPAGGAQVVSLDSFRKK